MTRTRARAKQTLYSFLWLHKQTWRTSALWSRFHENYGGWLPRTTRHLCRHLSRAHTHTLSLSLSHRHTFSLYQTLGPNKIIIIGTQESSKKKKVTKTGTKTGTNTPPHISLFLFPRFCRWFSCLFLVNKKHWEMCEWTFSVQGSVLFRSVLLCSTSSEQITSGSWICHSTWQCDYGCLLDNGGNLRLQCTPTVPNV